MQHHTDPTYAIDQIDAFLSKIDYLQQLDCENPDGEREITKLEINIRGFLRTYFKEYKEKLQDLKNDRSDYITKHFFDPDNLVNDQRDYENDLEIIKNHLIAYKTELESINNSRRKAVLPTQPKRITKKTSTNPPVVKKQTSKEKSLDNRKVFIVHGHNETSKTAVESFLIALELEPIILHKQADLGKTIIEKVEHYSDVGFAIILLTKDDFGGELPSGSTNEYNLLSKYMETPDQIPR
ncbi:MAG: nucleotide-binding protein, partial [Methanoregula sp.]|nr:nucleotide-binding protein [Methanoregula sp.]